MPDASQMSSASTLPAGVVRINAVLGSTTGTDSEYVELFGVPGTSLDGLSVIVVESDDQASNGTIDRRIDLTGADTIGANGFFLLANGLAETTYGVTADKTISNNTIENSSYTLALVETSSLTGSTVAGTEVVLDAVGVTDGEAGTSSPSARRSSAPMAAFCPPVCAAMTMAWTTISRPISVCWISLTTLPPIRPPLAQATCP